MKYIRPKYIGYHGGCSRACVRGAIEFELRGAGREKDGKEAREPDTQVACGTARECKGRSMPRKQVRKPRMTVWLRTRAGAVNVKGETRVPGLYKPR